MLSVTPEPPVSAPAYNSRARQERLDPPSDGFSALVNNDEAVADTDRKPGPASDTVRNDPREDRRNEPVANSKETAAPGLPRALSTKDGVPADAPPPTQPVIQTDAGNESGKKQGAINILPDEKKAEGDEASSDTADTLTASQPVPSLAPDALAIVTVMAAAIEPAATPVPNHEAPSAPAAIAAAAVATAAAVVSAISPQVTAKAEKSADTGMTAAAEGDVALPGDTDPEVLADGTAVLSSAAAPSSLSGKTEASTKPAKDAISGKGGKHAADTSQKVISPDQAEKPDAGAVATGNKPAQHAKPAADAKPDTDAAAPADKAAPLPEHRSQATAPSPQHTLQPDQILQSPTAPLQLPAQSHLANLTAVPVSPAQAALTANTPVPISGLAVDIALRAAGGSSRFEIRLDPAELGRIDVQLDVDKHGNVTSHLTVERPATLDMLRRDAPQLQQALEDAGLKTGNSGLQFSLRDQSSSGRDGDNGSGRNSQRLVITDEEIVPARVAERSYGRMLTSSGGIDIRI